MSHNIFINYRRDDSAWASTSLYNGLAQSFDQSQLFKDVDSMPPGIDFVDELDKQLSQCDVFLAVIGRDWLNILEDKTGMRRIDNLEDFVRIEIQSALDRKIPVIPILVDGAQMPAVEDLPTSLAPLTRINATSLRHESFGTDVNKLSSALKQLLASVDERRKKQIEDQRIEQQKQAEQLAFEQEVEKGKLAEQKRLDQKEREDAAWTAAISANNAADYKAYLRDYPTGAYIANARAAIKEQSPFPTVHLVAKAIAIVGVIATLAGGYNWYKSSPYSISSFDQAQLKRGFQVYAEVCGACHSIKHMIYEDLTTPGGPAFTAAELKKIIAGIEVPAEPDEEGRTFDESGNERGFRMMRAAISSDYFASPYLNEQSARSANGGSLPPDMSLIAKQKTAEYIENLLLSYEDEPPKGIDVGDKFYNRIFPGNAIAMPQPLGDGTVGYADGTKPTLKQHAADISVFLAWISEYVAANLKTNSTLGR